MALTKFERAQRFMPNFYRIGNNAVITALVRAWCQSDETVALNIEETHDQLFVRLADGKYLDYLGSNMGVVRPTSVGPLSDDQYRQYILKAGYEPKTVRKLIYEILDIFWGPTYSHPTLTSTAYAPFVFTAISYLDIIVDNHDIQTVTFPVGSHTAQEICDIINEALTGQVIAQVYTDGSTSRDFVQIYTTTPGLAGSLKVNSTVENSVGTAIYHGTTGLNDARSGGAFTGTSSNVYTVEISSTAPDTFQWSIGSGTPSAPVTITGLEQALSLGVTVTFGNLLGHTIGDYWVITPKPSANQILAFPTAKTQETSVTIIEMFPNHIIIKIPTDVPFGANIRWASYLHTDATIIDPRPAAITSSAPFWPGHFLYDYGFGTTGVKIHDYGANIKNYLFGAFDPMELTYSVTSTTCLTKTIIPAWSSLAYGKMSVDNCLSFPNAAGRVILGLGTPNAEIINYSGRSAFDELTIDAGHTFTHEWPIDTVVTYVTDKVNPRVTGDDYAIYFIDTNQGQLLVTELMDIIKAAGVILEFDITRVHYLFEGYGLPWVGYGGGGGGAGSIDNWFQVPTMAVDPATGGWGATDAGKTWFNTTDLQLKLFNGSSIVLLA